MSSICIMAQGSGLRAQGSGRNYAQKLLSVIIPAYNTAKFLNKCVESVVNQTYKNIEIIIVNNGSTDNTPQICDELKAKYNNRKFKIINLNPNQGINWARRDGVKAASGEYIAFIDSDDYLEPTAYEQTIKVLEEHDCDMAQFGIKLVDRDGNLIEKWERQDLIFNNTSEAYKYLFTDRYPAWNVWDKVYKRELFKNLEWPKISALEDYCMSAQLFAKAQKFITINKNFYNWLQRDDSTMHKPVTEGKLEDSLIGSALVVDLTQQKFPALMPEVLIRRADCIYGFCIYILNVPSAKQEKLNSLAKTFMSDYKLMRSELKAQQRELYIKDINEIQKLRFPRKRQIIIWLIANCPNLYKNYLKLRLKIHDVTGI